MIVLLSSLRVFYRSIHTGSPDHIKQPKAPVSVHLFSAEKHIARLVIAEAFVFGRKQIVVKHQEVSVLAGRDGTLARLDAKLLKEVVMQSKPSFPQNR